MKYVLGDVVIDFRGVRSYSGSFKVDLSRTFKKKDLGTVISRAISLLKSFVYVNVNSNNVKKYIFYYIQFILYTMNLRLSSKFQFVYVISILCVIMSHNVIVISSLNKI